MERDNWENSAIDDFYQRIANRCTYCGDDRGDDCDPPDGDLCDDCHHAHMQFLRAGMPSPYRTLRDLSRPTREAE